MKNIIIKIILIFSIFTILNVNSYAATSETASGSGGIKIIVTEKIPWAWCIEINSKWEAWKAEEWKTQMYECNVQKWFWSVIEMFWKMIKYFTFICALWGVLFIVINWILYSMWWAEPSLKDDAKKRIIWTLVWLVVLFLSWVILNLIAPWIYK